MKPVYQPDIDMTARSVVDAYDEVSLWSALAGQLLLRHLPFSRNHMVLDIGCGTGFPAIELAERLGFGSTVIGLDKWEEGLQRARRKAAAKNVAQVTFVTGHACALPFPEGSFDLIVSNLGINNFEDAVIALRECRRVSDKNARLALTTNLRGHWHEFYSVFESIVDDSTRSALQLHINHRATIDGLNALLKESHFECVRVEEDNVVMRFADGTAFLDHSFIRLGFFPAWRNLIPAESREETFRRLEIVLNREASRRGGLALTVPLAYVEAIPV
jgi:arsenite methyltransferase